MTNPNFEELFDELPARVYIKDLSHKFVYVNKAMANAFGKEPEDMIGYCDDDFFTAQHAKDAKIDEKRIIETGEAVEGKEELEHWKDSRISWVSTTKKRLEVDGEVKGIIGVSVEVSKEKRKRTVTDDNSIPYEISASLADDGLWHCDLTKRKVKADNESMWYSHRWKELFGFSDEEAAKSWDMDFWDEHIHPEDLERDKEIRKRYYQGKLPIYESEFRFRHKEGTYRWILARGAILRDERKKPIVFAGIHTDITDAMEKKERVLTENIGHCFAHRSALLNTICSTLKRTYGNSDVLNTLQLSINYFTHASVIAQLLTKEKEVEIDETVSVRAVIENSIKIFSYEDDLEIESDLVDADVKGHEFHLSNAIFELFVNARDFSREAELKPKINVVMKIEGEFVEIHVKDNGPGINNKLKMAELFEMYQTSLPDSRTGIGLNYVKMVVDSHNGNIRCEESDSGAHFIIALPICQNNMNSNKTTKI